jgi:hypothetical protein
VRRVVFLLVPGVHLLDLAGPAQVFSTAADHGYDYRLHYVAEQERVPTVQGVPLVADTRWPELGPDDLLLVPGWRPAAHGPRAGGPAGSCSTSAPSSCASACGAPPPTSGTRPSPLPPPTSRR